MNRISAPVKIIRICIRLNINSISSFAFSVYQIRIHSAYGGGGGWLNKGFGYTRTGTVR